MQLEFTPTDAQIISAQNQLDRFMLNEANMNGFVEVWKLSQDRSAFFSNPLRRDQLIEKDSVMVLKQIGSRQLYGMNIPKFKLFIASVSV
jgi:hypothetical protein